MIVCVRRLRLGLLRSRVSCLVALLGFLMEVSVAFNLSRALCLYSSLPGGDNGGSERGGVAEF